MLNGFNEFVLPIKSFRLISIMEVVVEKIDITWPSSLCVPKYHIDQSLRKK